MTAFRGAPVVVAIGLAVAAGLSVLVRHGVPRWIAVAGAFAVAAVYLIQHLVRASRRNERAHAEKLAELVDRAAAARSDRAGSPDPRDRPRQ